MDENPCYEKACRDSNKKFAINVNASRNDGRDWKEALTERREYEYNYALTAMQVYPHTGSLPLEYST